MSRHARRTITLYESVAYFSRQLPKCRGFKSFLKVKYYAPYKTTKTTHTYKKQQHAAQALCQKPFLTNSQLRIKLEPAQGSL